MGKVEKIDAICESFYDVGTELSSWTPILNRLSRTLGRQGCDLHLLRHGTPIFSFMGGQPDAIVEEYVERFIHREPRSQFLMSARPGQIATDLNFVSAEFMRTSDYYADFLARGNMGHCVAGVPIQNREQTAYFGFHLPRDAGPPDNAVMRLVARIQPHLNRAIQTQFHLVDAQLKNAVYSEAFDNLNVGIVIVGHRQEILVANKVAEDILNEGTVLHGRGRRLGAARSDESGSLSSMIASAVGRRGEKGGAGMLRGTGSAPVSVTVTPTSSTFREHTGAAAMIFLAPFHASRDRNWSTALRDLYGLTSTESRVASLLANGRSTKEAAEELALTYETVRSVIKSVFAKTGTRRQGELIALIHTAVPSVIRLPAGVDE